MHRAELLVGLDGEDHADEPAGDDDDGDAGDAGLIEGGEEDVAGLGTANSPEEGFETEEGEVTDE